MPTQEERINTLEINLASFKTETITIYREVAVELTMTKGLTEDAVKRLAAMKAQIDQRFDASDKKLDGLEFRVQHIEESLAEQRALLGHQGTMIAQQATLLAQILERLP